MRTCLSAAFPFQITSNNMRSSIASIAWPIRAVVVLAKLLFPEMFALTFLSSPRRCRCIRRGLKNRWLVRFYGHLRRLPARGNAALAEKAGLYLDPGVAISTLSISGPLRIHSKVLHFYRGFSNPLIAAPGEMRLLGRTVSLALSNLTPLTSVAVFIAGK